MLMVRVTRIQHSILVWFGLFFFLPVMQNYKNWEFKQEKFLKTNYWNWASDPGKTTSTSLYLQSLSTLMAILYAWKWPQVGIGCGNNNTICEVISETTIIMLFLITISFSVSHFPGLAPSERSAFSSCVWFNSKSQLRRCARVAGECEWFRNHLWQRLFNSLLLCHNSCAYSSFLLFREENLCRP